MENKPTHAWNNAPMYANHLKFPKRVKHVLYKIVSEGGTYKIDMHKKLISTYIYGDVGTGKTVLACKLILDELGRCSLMPQPTFKYAFISVPELFLQIKNTYSKKLGYGDLVPGGPIMNTENAIVDYYASIEVLILDDLGAEKTSDWSWTLLYLIINRRYENMLITIVTSNFALDDLAAKMGDDRIPSRLQEMCITRQCTKSYR